MPLNKKELSELQINRTKMKQQVKSNEISSHISFAVLGNGSKGNPKSLFIVTDWDRYLFNCGEGTQRLANEHKIKLSKLEHIFVTSTVWSNIGGLPGLALTMQDIGVPKITLHGPPNVEDIFKHSQAFLFVENIKICASKDSTFTENNLKVESITLEARPNNPNKRIRLDNSQNIIAFLGTFSKTPGHINIDMCNKLGIPKGPLLGLLKKGQEIMLENGLTIKPEQVLTPGEPGIIFLIVDCPSKEYILSLINNQKIKSNINCGSPDKCISLVFHFTPTELIADPQYQEWLGIFPSFTTHVYLNERNPSLSSVSIHRIQTMLNMLHPRIFPMLHEIWDAASIPLVGTMAKYCLRPRKGLENVTGPIIDTQIYKEEARANPGFVTHFSHLQNILKRDGEWYNETDSRYPETIFLGTGSAIPSKVRNVSSILITINPEGTKLMLDCGEGTLGQLTRFFGHNDLDSVLITLKAIFISHLHADHHLGLFSLLIARHAAFINQNKKFTPLILFAPSPMSLWLQGYSSNYQHIKNLYTFISNTSLLQRNLIRESLQSALSLKELRTVLVKHCKNSFGITLTTNSGHKIVYSGDTMPCEALVEAGKNCHLLIHEATMEDDLKEDAFKKMHSTTSQALDIGHKMNAAYIILTHFSQRYAKIPLFNNNFHSNVGIAFDNMIVWPSIYPLLSHFLPILKCIFSEHYEQMQEKTAKKQKKVLIEQRLKNIEISSGEQS